MKAKLFVVSALLVPLLLPAGSASAASACKGLSETACSANPDCGWTEGYIRRDGREVGPYCRTRPKSKKTAQQVEVKGRG